MNTKEKKINSEDLSAIGSISLGDITSGTLTLPPLIGAKINARTNFKMRGFEVAKGFEDKEINLPKRSTINAAGYDFEAAEDVVLKADNLRPTLIPTGIKAYMLGGEYLQLANRSSNPLKRDMVLANGIGVVDSDYYNNKENDGHIMFQFYNFSDKDIFIKKGERIGQGIFNTYLMVDQPEGRLEQRTGGFGSTGKS